MIIKKYKNHPGEIRHIKRFAFIPIFVERSWVWLQYYWVKQTYSDYSEHWYSNKKYLKKP